MEQRIVVTVFVQIRVSKNCREAGKSFFNDCMRYLAIVVGWNRKTVQESFAERNARSRKEF